MARKSKRTRRQIHESRRARRHAKRDKKGRRRSTFEMIPSIAGLPPLFIQNVPRGSEDTYDRYVAAHVLVPKDLPAVTLESQAHVARALCLIDDPMAPTESLLWAIMVLGHAPQAGALQALQRHAESGREHADMAWMAADECVEWMAQPTQVARMSDQSRAAPSTLN